MAFNKLMGGKVYAVAADSFSAVFEKKDGKRTNVQKQEDGLPFFSSSGFYSLSSKEYPALDMSEAYSLLRNKGAVVWLVYEQQLAARTKVTLADDMDWEVLMTSLENALSDANNRVTRFDVDMNRKRQTAIRRAQEDTEAAEEEYKGVEFAELAVSKKDGNPFVLFSWRIEGADPKAGAIAREAEEQAESRTITHYFDAKEALERFCQSVAAREIAAALASGKRVEFGYVQGNVFRTSPSFRGKVEEIIAKGPQERLFGDAVYVHAALKQWTKAIVTVMFSRHPSFPQADYDSHHYVAACRQAEVGANKQGNSWGAWDALQYRLAAELLK